MTPSKQNGKEVPKVNKILKVTIATLICLNMNILFASDISSYIGNEKALDDVNYKMAKNRAILLAEQDSYQVAEVKQSKVVVEEKSEKAKEVIKEESKVKYVSRGVPRNAKNGASFKSFMSYKMITNKYSKQYKFQKECFTDSNGLRRYTHDDITYYCGALGSFYSTKIGTRFRVTIENDGVEKIIFVVLSDCKDNRDTDKTNSHIGKNGNVIEFLVNQRKLSSLALRMGDVSYSGDPNLKGRIIKIEEIKD